MSTDSIWASLNEWIKEGQRRYHQSSPGRHLSELRQRTPLLDAVLLSGALLTSGWILRMGLRRFRTANDIPASFFSRHATLRGIVCCVNDSDNLRVLHLSPFQRFFPAPLPKQGVVKKTINVRLAGIDAPEMGHFGWHAQPYSKEAQQWLENYTKGRRVTLTLHRMDQYGRAVATVHIRRWGILRRNVSLAMVRAGYATVYHNSGAQYGGIKDELMEAEAWARKKKLGMWKQSLSNYVSPSQFKSAMRAVKGSK